MIRFFVRHRTTVTIIGLFVLLFGLWSYRTLPRENFPEIKIPIVLVTTPYVGVSPSDVEALITNKIEAELASLSDLRNLTSSSAEGFSLVAVEFEPEVDLTEALQKVRDRVNKARPKLPEDAEEPSVQEVSFSNFPIMLVTLTGPDEVQLKAVAEDLEDVLGRVSGVLGVDISGGRDRMIRVQVDPGRLGHYGLSLNDVTGAIGNENINIPGGTVTVGDGTFLLRTPSEILDPRQLERVALKRVGDRPVFLADVARVVDGFEDRQTWSRLSAQPSVTLAVKKRTGANVLEMADGVRAAVAAEATTWPEGVGFEILSDQSEDIEIMVADLENNIIAAVLLVVGIVLLVMGARPAMFVALSIPLSMAGTFIALGGFDYSLNTVVLFSLVLALGMMVDNAIVVVENIYRHLEMGKTSVEAAIDGTNEVFWPVTGSTATTVVAFLPLIWWTGVMGQFMGYMPRVLIIVLLFSLLAATVVVPPMATFVMPRMLGQGKSEAEIIAEESAPVRDGEYSLLGRAYLALLRLSIRRRYLSAIAMAALLVFSVGAFTQLNHGVEFFPTIPPERAVVGVRLPEGADLDATDRVVRGIEAQLPKLDNIESWVAEVGVSPDSDPMSGASGSANEARITVNFRPSVDKWEEGELPQTENTFVTLLKMREGLGQVAGAKITVEPQEFGPPVGKPISVEVSGKDFFEVGEAAEALRRELEQLPGVAALTTDFRVGRPELRLRVDRGAVKRVGASSAEVASNVRTAIAGSKASALRDGEEEHDIVVELAPEARDDLQKVLALRIPGREDTSPATFAVPLSAVATYELAGGAGAISHKDQKLVVTIAGDTQPQFNENEVQVTVAAHVAAASLPEGVVARTGGSADEQKEASEFLTWAFALALSLVAAVLVAQFDGLALPGVIMVTVLLSLIGVLWGLIVTGTPFGIIMTGIGVISLAGVVVNNAIVLLDFVVELRRRGMSVEDALVKAGVTRLRPVLLTAATTALGILPMAIGLSIDFFNLRLLWGTQGSLWWGPMAVAVIFGLSFATVLTLVMVPTLYGILDDVLRLIDRLTGSELAGVSHVVAALLAVGLVAGPAEAATLEEAWTAAEASSAQLRMAQETVVQIDAQRWQRLAPLLPQVDLAASFTINQQEVELDMSGGVDPAEIPEPFQDLFAGFAGDPIIVQAKTAWTGRLSIYQTLLNGQALPGLQGLARLGRAARSDLERTRDQLRASVARAYYGLVVARESAVLAERQLETARHLLDLAQRQVAAGLADRRAVLQGELSIARAERGVAAATEQMVAAEQGFARLTGLSADTAVEMPTPTQPPGDVEAALQAAWEHRPDLAGAAERVEAAKRFRTASDLGWAPTVGIGFRELYSQVPGFVPEKFQWQVGLDFSWNLWDGGYRISRSRELASQVRVADLAVEQIRDGAEAEIRTLFQTYERAETALRGVEAEIRLAEEGLRLAETAVVAGRGTWLEVEQARLALEAARMGLLTERMDRDLAAIDLAAATGLL